MHEHNSDRVKFFSREDGAAGHYLQKSEPILRAVTKSAYNDINDVLELYNIKKYIDNELYLRSWTQEDIAIFKQKVTEYGSVIGQFMAVINDNNVLELYEKTVHDYLHSFWEIACDQSVFKRISKTNFSTILSNEPYVIYEILEHKGLVDYYNTEIKNFLLTYEKSAEILLSIYEVKQNTPKNQKYLPKSLTTQDKENILSTYLDSEKVNVNYVGLIQNIRNQEDFKVSDKTRLKAKRLHQSETEKFFADKSGMRYGISVSFSEDMTKIKEGFIDENSSVNYSYNLSFIKQNNNPYSLFQNFKFLFEYVDSQNRINLANKGNETGLMKILMGLQSQNEYYRSIAFNLSETTSHIQIAAYNKIVTDFNNSLENILHHVFTSVFPQKYAFAPNARFSIPTATSHLEKVRFLAPEFEAVLKQFKLFVEDGSIDFELLQISSSSSAIKDIPSLNTNKYFYLNNTNQVALSCSNLFFSDQTLLACVEPFKEKYYHNFFELLMKEQVTFSNYEEYQKPALNYLIDNGFISVSDNDFIEINNVWRLLVLKDLNDNKVASFHRYPIDIQKEVLQMKNENFIFFDSSLFSKPEQEYFNYYLNKSMFTNSLDLRNSYLHGTQANPEETQKHKYAYFSYLKLLFLAMFKIEDDLSIAKAIKAK